MKKIVILLGIILVTFLFFVLGTKILVQNIPPHPRENPPMHELRGENPRREYYQNRVPPVDRKFMLVSIGTNLKQDQLIINCSFARSLHNPESISKSIFVNNQPLTQINSIKFNRMGTLFKIFVSPEETSNLIKQKKLTISIRNIKSVEGDSLEYSVEKDIKIGKIYVFEEDGTCFVY